MGLMDQLMGQLQGGGIDEISHQVGASNGQVSQVISGALPAILAGLNKNCGSSTGQNALSAALDKDHSGSVLGDVVGFLGSGSSAGIGSGILRHVLGTRQPNVESALGQASGLDSGQVGQILAMVAPLVMGALGKAKQQNGLDGAGLASLLGGEQKTVAKKAPDAMDLLGRLIDSDGDGEVMDDVGKLGTSLLGRLLGGR